MDQINHIGWPCDSELRFCGTAQRFWTQRPSARLAGWLADARKVFLSLLLELTKQMAIARTQACHPSQASIHPETSDERDYGVGDVEKDRVDGVDVG